MWVEQLYITTIQYCLNCLKYFNLYHLKTRVVYIWHDAQNQKEIGQNCLIRSHIFIAKVGNHRDLIRNLKADAESHVSVSAMQLTHWNRVQRAATLADNIFKCNFVHEIVVVSTKKLWNFIPEGPINNKSSLIEVMAWRRSNDCLFYRRIYASLSLKKLTVYGLVMHVCASSHLSR